MLTSCRSSSPGWHHGSSEVKTGVEITTSGCPQGYPGTVRATVTYVLKDGLSRTEASHLRVIMEATTDKVNP